MRHLRLSLVVALTVLTSTAARADAEYDRLREALRNATAQSRSLEDQRAALQAKLTTTEQERDRLKKQNEAYRAQVKEAEQAYRQAVKDFNDRLDRTRRIRWKNGRAPTARPPPSPAPRMPSAPSSRARRRPSRPAARRASPRTPSSSRSATTSCGNTRK